MSTPELCVVAASPRVRCVSVSHNVKYSTHVNTSWSKLCPQFLKQNYSKAQIWKDLFFSIYSRYISPRGRVARVKIAAQKRF